MFAANANIPQTQRDKLAAGRKLRKKVSFYVTKLLLNQGSLCKLSIQFETRLVPYRFFRGQFPVHP